MKEKMLKVSPGFQYSVNIKYDIENAQKISSYIPTEKAIMFLEELVKSLEDSSKDRARLLIGPYGTGKSHLVAVFGALLEAKLPLEVFKPILEKLSASGMTELVNLLESRIGRDRYLTVIINGNGKNLEQSLLIGLDQSLKSAGISELLPDTVFKYILETIDLWEKTFINTFEQFEKLLFIKYSMTIKDFRLLIEEFNHKAYTILKDLYPSLTSGAEFNPLIVDDVSQLYQDVAKKLQYYNYKGIYVIFDEFNKHLETSVKEKEIIDLKPLQDFAEMCNRSEQNQVHLMLVSHQHISQYASKLSQELIDEWRKVEGRFRTFELTQRVSKTYNLISKVVIKDKYLWTSFLKENRDKFKQLNEKANIFGLFRDLSSEELDNWVVKGCYPLHPTTTYCLPKISNKIAQNERTIFTFLSTNDFNSLGSFIENNSEGFSLLTLDILYDYFADLMKKQNYQDPIYNTWLNTSKALQKVKETDILAQRIIKTLGLINAVDEEQYLPSTIEIIKFALNIDKESEEEFTEVLKYLVQKKILYLRKSDNRIQFFKGSDINFSEEIDRVKGNHRYQNMFNKCYILNNNFLPYPIIANRYNDEFEMTRFFIPKYFSINELLKGIDWDKEIQENNYADGILALIIRDSEVDTTEMISAVKNIKHKQVLAAYSGESLNIESLIDFQALNILKSDQHFIEKDPLVTIELEAYLEDYQEQIEGELAKLIDPRLETVQYYYQGERILNIKSGAKLSRLISDICTKIFDKTPKINNELINKNNLTPTITNARKKVNDRLLAKDLALNLGLSGYGPDVSIFRSLLKRTGVYEELEGKAILKDPMDLNLSSVITEINNWLLSSSKNKITFKEIIEVLRRPPYGLRLGIIPIVLAISFRNFRDVIVIKDQRDIEEPLSADLLENIAKYPENYTIQLEEWDENKEKYIQYLYELFKENINEINESSNRILPVAIAIKSWFVSLPKFTRETSRLVKDTISFRKALRNPSLDSKELLFKKLPFYLDDDQIFNGDNYTNYLIKIEKAKTELESHLEKIKEILLETITSVFGGKDDLQNSISHIRNWYDKLEKQTKVHLFTGMAGNFLEIFKNFSGYDNKKFIELVSHNITGLRIEDWSDEVFDNFKLIMTQVKDTIDNFNNDQKTGNNAKGKLVKIITFNDDGQDKEITFEQVEITDLGQLLLNSIESNIDSFADSITVNEKRQVLLNLLDKLA